MSLKRALRKGADENVIEDERSIGKIACRLLHALAHGEYRNTETGRMVPVTGDTSKLSLCKNLSRRDLAMIRNYQFMSTRIPGTRQVRNEIRHVIFASRVFYGIPVFMTITPGERHSGLAIRLFRGRENDPAFMYGSSAKFKPWIGRNVPSLKPEDHEDESVTIDLPGYDDRKLITSRDPLCCVYAFQVFVRVVLPALYGFQMCPDCPDCAESKCPCMDIFGSNATPMGGSAGRADALVGAVEAQKAEGVLHLHMFL